MMRLCSLCVGCWLVVVACSSYSFAQANSVSTLPATQPGETDASSFDGVSPFDGMVFYCTECKKEVPEHIGAGSDCPHCGAYFRSATTADGAEVEVETQRGISLRVWCGIALFLIFATEYVVRRWRKGRVVA